MSFLQRPTVQAYRDALKKQGRATPVVQEALAKAESLLDSHKKVCYIAGALTGMSEAVKARYQKLSDLLGGYEALFGYAPHLHGTDPIAHPHVTPGEVRDIDFLFAAVVPELHINLLAPVAHGNGIEAGWAELYDIPSIHVVPRDVHLSRLVRGMHNIASTITYQDFDGEVIPAVRRYAEEHML